MVTNFTSDKNINYLFSIKNGMVVWEKLEKSDLVLQSSDKIFR